MKIISPEDQKSAKMPPKKSKKPITGDDDIQVKYWVFFLAPQKDLQMQNLQDLFFPRGWWRGSLACTAGSRRRPWSGRDWKHLISWWCCLVPPKNFKHLISWWCWLLPRKGRPSLERKGSTGERRRTRRKTSPCWWPPGGYKLPSMHFWDLQYVQFGIFGIWSAKMLSVFYVCKIATQINYMVLYQGIPMWRPTESGGRVNIKLDRWCS